MPAPAPAPSGPPTTQAGVAALDFIPEAESPGNYMLPVLYPLSAPNSPVIGDYYRVSVFQDPRIYLYRWVDVKLKGTNTLVASGYTYVLGATDSHPNGGLVFHHQAMVLTIFRGVRVYDIWSMYTRGTTRFVL